MIRIAIVGVGNCASAFVQGVSYYRRDPKAPGMILPIVCGYEAGDIEFVAAFDVDRSKVGQKLSKGIFRGRNETATFCSSITGADCAISPAPILDGAGSKYAQKIRLIDASNVDVDRVLQQSQPDVLINYLPVGSDDATVFWATKCLEHGIAFLNAIPSFIVSKAEWAKKFEVSRLPCAGDDVKSQVGATIIHRVLVHLFNMRGARINSTYQLNFGGNMDFFNMLEEGRLVSKRKSKVQSVMVETKSTSDEQIHVSPTDYIQFLGDRKIAYINLSAEAFGGLPLELECKLSVWDSPNSAGVVMDVVRFLAAAKDRGEGGALPICSQYFKSPPSNLSDMEGEILARSIASVSSRRKLKRRGTTKR